MKTSATYETALERASVIVNTGNRAAAEAAVVLAIKNFASALATDESVEQRLEELFALVVGGYQMAFMLRAKLPTGTQIDFDPATCH
jgi:hypothetical protein